MAGILGSELQPLNQDPSLRINDSELRKALSAVYSRGAFAVNSRTYTTNAVLDHRISTIMCDTSSGPISLTLPYANYWGEQKSPKLTFAHIAGVGDVTINVAGGNDVINNVLTSYTLKPGERIDMVSDGVRYWFVFAASSSGGPFVDEAGDIMTGTLQFKDGSLSGMAWKFTSTSTGMYYDGGMVIAVGNVPRWKFDGIDAHMLPMASYSYNIGSPSLRIKNTYIREGVFGYEATLAPWNITANSGQGALQVGNRTSLIAVNSGGTAGVLAQNVYRDGSTFKYITSGPAQTFNLNPDGGFRWFTAPSGTANSSVTFTEQMELNSDFHSVHVPVSTKREISVHEYGAVGDYDPDTKTGTDDSSAIQDALDAAATQGGGIVTLEADKRYRLNAAITIPIGVTLQGPMGHLLSGFRGEDGYGFTNPATPPTTRWRDLGGALWITFSAGVGDGSSTYNVVDVAGLPNFANRDAAIYLQGKIEGVFIFNQCFDNGLHQQCTDNTNWNAEIGDVSSGGHELYNGLALRADAEDSFVHNCFIGGFMQAYLAYNESRPRIDGLWFDCVNGIELSSIFDVAYISNVHGFPFACTGYQLGSLVRRGSFMWLHDTVDWPKISNCFTYGHKHGFYCANITGAEFVNCSADNISLETGAYYGIRIIQNCQEITFTNFKFANREYGADIDVSSGNQVTLVGFRGSGTNTYGVRLNSGGVSIHGAELSSGTAHFYNNGGNNFVVVGPTCTGAGAFSQGNVMAIMHGQIQFPSSQNASADPNTLDDYEEGTFTPSVTFDGGSTGQTYSVQLGQYTKIGNRVIVDGRIVFTDKGSSTGNAVITGLPFTVSNSIALPSAVALWFSNLIYGGTPQGFTQIGTTNIVLDQISEAGTRTTLTDANFADNTNIVFHVAYRAA